jgi:hypothetical protein
MAETVTCLSSIYCFLLTWQQNPDLFEVSGLPAETLIFQDFFALGLGVGFVFGQ